MLDTDPSFRLVRVRDDYPPGEDLGLIGDEAPMALFGLDGGIYWLCLSRFDSEPVFCGSLDRDRGGHFTITPDGLTEARQRYEPDTGVLVTELRSPTGLVRVTDALALRSRADLTDDVPGGRSELVRSAVALDRVPEQVDPSTGEFIGNFPQAFSHISVIASGVTLARALAATGSHTSTAGAPA